MRKVENTISTFVLGKFRDNLIKFLGNKVQSHENDRLSTLKKISDVESNLSYSPNQIASSIESYKRSLRVIENRKASVAKKIKLLSEVDPSGFEKELKKIKQYDGYFIDNENRLNLYTKMLKDGSRNIGRFRICILEDQARNSNGLAYLAVNLDYHRNDLEHWAINENRCCMGEWEIDFQKAMWEADIPKFFQTFILYVTLSPEEHTYTTKHDWYTGRVKRTKEISDQLRTKDIHNLYYEEDEDDEFEEDD